jgi:hypothetical protein
MAFSRSFEPVPIQVAVGAVSATATRGAGVAVPGNFWYLKAVDLTDVAAVAGDNTNRYVVTINKGTIAAPVPIVSFDLNLASGGLVAHTPKSIPLTAVSEALRTLMTTDVLHAVLTKNGTAVNFTNLTVTFWLTSVVDKAAAA